MLSIYYKHITILNLWKFGIRLILFLPRLLHYENTTGLVQLGVFDSIA